MIATSMLPKDKENLNKEWNDSLGGTTKYGSVMVTTAKLRALDIGLTPAQSIKPKQYSKIKGYKFGIWY